MRTLSPVRLRVMVVAMFEVCMRRVMRVGKTGKEEKEGGFIALRDELRMALSGPGVQRFT